MSKLSTSLAALSFAVCSLTSLGADAQDVKLPPTMTMTAYDTGTVGFNLTVAIGKALKDKYGTDVRVLPAGNDVARIAPLRAGRAIASGMGGGTYFAQEGVFEFATKEWGPQQLQMTLSTVDCAAGDLGVAADIGAKKMSDLKGKRIGFVVGSAALNQFALAMLAFGDLTQKDVKIVEFSSYGAMWKGMINNDVDAAFGNTVTGPAREMEASPRGLIWMPLPHDDDAGWARVWKVAAFLTKFTATCGAGGITKDKPVQMSTYPYPIYTVYANQPEDQVYMLTKAMITTFDGYKDAPGSAGMDAKLQTKNWVIPVHKGAVKALKEVGAWSDDQESFNNNLFKRQAALTAAWTDYMKSNPPSDEAQFKTGWMKARGDGLAKAGLPSNFE